MISIQQRCLELKRYLLSPFSKRKPCVLRKKPHYRVLLLQLPLLNLHDPTSLVPKVASPATGPAHPSEPGGSGRLLPSRPLLQQQRPWRPRHHLLNRVLVQWRRAPRGGTVRNMSTEKVVWDLMSWMEMVKVCTASIEQTCVTPKLKR